ncbi:MAG: rod shape-determining protein MreC [Flavobacteriales bacterium TMED84]|nr:MAG: rod shape-determining protein MreC [Flavobacteriales bacterium TMED84]
MYNLIRFFKIYQSTIYFIIFFSFSIYLLFTNNSYHSFLNKKTFSELRGYSMSKISSINQYLSLKEKNKILLNENVRIKNQLSKYSLKKNINFVDYGNYYLFNSARVINNSVFKRNNFLTLNKGSKDGIKIGQGVVINDGIVGIVKGVSQNYSLVMSVLNKKTNVSIKFKKNNYVGSLKWNGYNYKKGEVKDVMNHIDILVGDTIVTSGYGTIFPKDIKVGVVSKIRNRDNSGYQKIEVNFLKDLNMIDFVYVVEAKNKLEIRKLEKSLDD